MSTTTLGERIVSRLKSFVESVDPKKEVKMKMSKLVRAKFKVKIKSLAEEAKIIRHEERKMVDDVLQSFRGQLRHHRVSIVRNEQRATLLAYALVRGVPYCVLEAKSRPVDVKAVKRIVSSLAWRDVDVEAWIGAKATV